MRVQIYLPFPEPMFFFLQLHYIPKSRETVRKWYLGRRGVKALFKPENFGYLLNVSEPGRIGSIRWAIRGD